MPSRTGMKKKNVIDIHKLKPDNVTLVEVRSNRVEITKYNREKKKKDECVHVQYFR